MSNKENRLLLLDGITSTAATKVPFELTTQDFIGASLPALKSSGLGTGDSVIIWEWVDGAWTDSGQTLDDGTASTPSTTILSVGKYAVTAVLATAGPVSCELNSTALR